MRGGLTRRMLISSGLLAVIIATAFAVLLDSVSDLRASERRARQSEEVLVEANRLERLVIDLETGQRGFIITGEERPLEPWRDSSGPRFRTRRARWNVWSPTALSRRRGPRP